MSLTVRVIGYGIFGFVTIYALDKFGLHYADMAAFGAASSAGIFGALGYFRGARDTARRT